ncbi:MAG: adenine nucleotide alpha hydrolase [Bauldia sp.]|nr:adenine nucleotide alpha hydrolase [Bauldia sp.]
MSAEPQAISLGAVLSRFGRLAVAVSGGVDSMTLATFAHRTRGLAMTAIHAVSPAVPADATRRVQELAATEGWDLKVVGAGEFDDARYRDNPVDRCYFCKTHLYHRIRLLTDDPIASGANLDDLGDYRPGLIAAAENDVVHPYVEAQMTKADVRSLARSLGLSGIAELPAQPCLASRIETGIAVDPDDLAFVEKAEGRLSSLAPRNATLRCRITSGGVELELDEAAMRQREDLSDVVRALCRDAGRNFAGVRSYRRGAMFVRQP